MHNWEPTLPIDANYNLVIENKNKYTSNSWWKQLFSTKIQSRDKNRRHEIPNEIKVGQKVLLKNQRKMDKKGGKFSFKF